MNEPIACATPFGLPPLREELQAAHDAMDASDDYQAFAVCRTHGGQAWEVNIREGNIYSALDDRYCDQASAECAGADWLQERRQSAPSADEQVHRELWQDWIAQARVRR